MEHEMLKKIEALEEQVLQKNFDGQITIKVVIDDSSIDEAITKIQRKLESLNDMLPLKI